MTESFLNMLPSAIGIAISPIPIVAVILMLMSKRAVSNGLAFVTGWVLSILVVSGMVILFASSVASSGNSDSSFNLVGLLLGFALLFLAVKQWNGRPLSGQKPKTPKWMNAIDKFTAPKSFGMAVLLAAVNPKNLLLIVSGAVIVATSDTSGWDESLLTLAFVVIASVSVVLPVVYYLLSPKTAVKMLQTSKQWLIGRNAVIMTVLLAVIGCKLIVQAIM
jgi:threonine/homoserine/homoserine lactone efflux protein